MRFLPNDDTPSDLDQMLDRQKRGWLDGSRPGVEELLRDSSLPSSTEVLLDLIYNEIVIREELGEQPADVALAWMLHNPVVTGPIIGPRTVEQLEGTMRALEIDLSAEDLTRLDEIWPGPGGSASLAMAVNACHASFTAASTSGSIRPSSSIAKVKDGHGF